MTRKENIFFLIISFFSIFLFSGCGIDHSVINDSYINRTEKVSLKTPNKNWILALTDSGVKLKNIQGASKGGMEYLFKKLKDFKKADEYIDEYIKNDFKSFSLKLKYKKKKIKIGNFQGYFAGFTGSFEYTPKEYGVALIVRNKTAHIFTYIFPTRDKQKNRKDFFSVLKSFKANL